MKLFISNTHSTRGFAFIACLSILALLTMLALAMVSLAEHQVVKNVNISYRDNARANARLALAQAIAALQESMGRDQAVCANLSILENTSDVPGTLADESLMYNRNWLGAWKSTVSYGGKEWPIIGKLPNNDKENDYPYAYSRMYEDLRHTMPSLTAGKWKSKMHQTWLVSGGDSIDPLKQYVESEEGNVLLVGKGSLGSLIASSVDYDKHKVVVPSVDITNPEGTVSGRFAYWVRNNNLSATIKREKTNIAAESSNEIMVSTNLAGVELPNKTIPFGKLKAELSQNSDGTITDSTLHIFEGVEKTDLSAAYYDFTTKGSGMHTNVQLGGFKKDLTPILFGEKSSKTIDLSLTENSTVDKITNIFKSSYPIIPGEGHTVIGPCFDDLRNWGLQRYREGIEVGKISADEVIPHTGKVHRDSTKWARSSSDGYTFDLASWSTDAPKIQPVMVEAGWFNGYSSSGKVGNNSNMRFHLAPRIVLWNPYNVKLEVPELAVIMPNFFRVFNNSGNPTSSDNFRIKFYVEDEYAEYLKSELTGIEGWNKEEDSSNDFSIPGGGSYYFFHINAKVDDGFKNKSWAPQSKYIGFTTEKTIFEPGQCLVFSADVGKVGESKHQVFSEQNVSLNRLSAYSKSGEDSFYLEPSFPGTEIKLGKSSNSNKALSSDDATEFIKNLDFEKVFRYRIESFPHVNPHATLKLSDRANFAVPVDTIATSSDYLSIQTVNCGNGGTQDGQFPMNNVFADSRLSVNISNSDDFPELVDYPRRFQSGVKLSWLDESYFEGNAQESYRLHPNDGLDSESVAFHMSPIAYGSVRPKIVTRAPHHFTTYNYYQYQAGNWMASFASPSPNESIEDSHLDDNGRFTKNPFGAASQHAGGRAVMFELPGKSLGCLSLTSLRHVELSPFSWHPTYVIGNSLADLSAPADYSAKPLLNVDYLESDIRDPFISNFFDFYLGGTRSVSNTNKYTEKRYWKYWSDSRESEITWGPSTGYQSWAYGITNSETLLQIGDNYTQKIIEGRNFKSRDEIMTYDISFEVNQNLYDEYFISGVPINITDSSSFSWSVESMLNNPLYSYNELNLISKDEVDNKYTGKDNLSYGFWNNGYLLKSNSQFNVNSTSVLAWTAVLSGMRDRVREDLARGVSVGEENHHVYSRVIKPAGGVRSNNLNAYNSSSYLGSRVLSDREIRLLAYHIVQQVKVRGPFLSLADFVNRRLSTPAQRNDIEMATYAQSHVVFDGSDDQTSRMGALEAAILASGINDGMESNPMLPSSAYHTKSRDSGQQPYGAHSKHRGYATHVDWQPDYRHRQIDSKSWGTPGYLTQGDVLTPISPMISVRGDTFTIRACGQAIEGGKVMAEAYLEAIVTRSCNYIDSRNGSVETPSAKIDAVTGEISFPTLSQINRKKGRRFILTSFKWISKNEL